MLLSILAIVSCLIALQAMMVVRVADWLSVHDGRDLSGSHDRAVEPAGRYAGLA